MLRNEEHFRLLTASKYDPLNYLDMFKTKYKQATNIRRGHADTTVSTLLLIGKLKRTLMKTLESMTTHQTLTRIFPPALINVGVLYAFQKGFSIFQLIYNDEWTTVVFKSYWTQAACLVFFPVRLLAIIPLSSLGVVVSIHVWLNPCGISDQRHWFAILLVALTRQATRGFLKAADPQYIFVTHLF